MLDAKVNINIENLNIDKETIGKFKWKLDKFIAWIKHPYQKVKRKNHITDYDIIIFVEEFDKI